VPSALDRRGDGAERRDDDERGVGEALLELGEQLAPAGIGEHEVHQDDVRGELGHPDARLGRRVGRAHEIAAALDPRGHDVRKLLLIVHDEDRAVHHASSRMRATASVYGKSVWVR
jgi:hypothetical protein